MLLFEGDVVVGGTAVAKFAIRNFLWGPFPFGNAVICATQEIG
jgi:hypothetical protein